MKELRMHVRARKFIGVFVFVVFTLFYFLTAISIAIVRLPETSTGVQVLFYLATTIIWVVISAALIWFASNKRDPDVARRYL